MAASTAAATAVSTSIFFTGSSSLLVLSSIPLLPSDLLDALALSTLSQVFRGWQVDRGVARVTCRKEGIHPKFYNQAEVYCNGELVMTTGGTQEKYVVDVWSGNHPFYQGKESAFLQDADRVDRFNKRFGVGSLSDVPILTKGEVVFVKKKKPIKGKGGKK